MNIEKLENHLQSIVTDCNKETFVYDLLLAYELPKASIARLKKGDYNLSKNPGEILWKKKLCFRHEAKLDLHSLIDSLKSDPAITKQHPRFIIVTDFKNLLSVDTKTDDTLDIPFQELDKHYDFFLPWSGMEKAQIQNENPADIKAAEKMGRLYDLVLEDNHVNSEVERHSLNIFFSRLLFCFFAEDTGIFPDDLFTNSLASQTAEDGSNLQAYLQKLFEVLNSLDRSGYPKFLQNFPYVNGGLFGVLKRCERHRACLPADEHPAPKFTAKSRKIIIECGALNWKEINPDIFGSMMQAVVHSDQRGSLGMHYTSVINIMKVIEPLFLNDLHEELERAGSNKKKLKKLLDRLYHLRIFDPACGSGNFLIITYKELSKLEIEIFKRLHGKQLSFRFQGNIRLTQFFGIELDDFAHETAKLSLWLAEHQMNMAFKEVFGEAKPTLPLQDGGNIACGNATRMDWQEICPKDDGCEIYILGNPPYLGARNQSKEQKNDMSYVFEGHKNYKDSDYVCCWFLKAAKFIQGKNAKYAFVSTNSICQGEQVAYLWPRIFMLGLEICFAHQSFIWTNNAKGNAGVICVVIGVRQKSSERKTLYIESISNIVRNISPYLTSGRSLCISRRKQPISSVPKMVVGSQARDGGNLILSESERDYLIDLYPEASSLIRPLIGSKEFIRGTQRWCLWIIDNQLDLAQSIPQICERIRAVHDFRISSKAKTTRGYASIPHKFAQRAHRDTPSIMIPEVSSERREYIPMGFFDSKTIVSNKGQVIYNAEPYIFGILTSRMHMVWVDRVAGRLKMDYNYSSSLCYNTFPFPDTSEKQKVTLEDHVFQVLDEREQHPEKTMAQLYDPDKMPEGLRQAHHEMDLAIEKCYRSRPFKNDEERLEYLFKLYEEMIEAEGMQ